MVSGDGGASAPEGICCGGTRGPSHRGLTKATSAVAVEQAVTNGSARNSPEESKCWLDLAKTRKEQPNQGGSSSARRGRTRACSLARGGVMVTATTQATGVGLVGAREDTALRFHYFLYWRLSPVSPS